LCDDEHSEAAQLLAKELNPQKSSFAAPLPPLPIDVVYQLVKEKAAKKERSSPDEGILLKKKDGSLGG